MTGPEVDTEALLRQVLVGHATLSEQITGLSSRVDGVQQDAREARDAARDSAAATRAQDIPAKFAELKGMVDQSNAAFRADLVNSISKVTGEMREGHAAHDLRIKALEDQRSRFQGATGLIGWIGRNAPWLAAAIAAGAAIFGLKDHHV